MLSSPEIPSMHVGSGVLLAFICFTSFQNSIGFVSNACGMPFHVFPMFATFADFIHSRHRSVQIDKLVSSFPVAGRVLFYMNWLIIQHHRFLPLCYLHQMSFFGSIKVFAHRRSHDLGGGTRPTPPSLASVVHTFEDVAGSWGSVSAPAVSRVMSGAPERKK